MPDRPKMNRKTEIPMLYRLIKPFSLLFLWVLVPGLPAALGQIPSVRFAVIGDFGLAGRPDLDVSNLVKSWNPDFIVTVGDNNYPAGAATTIDKNIGQYYHEFIYPYVGAYGPGAPTQNLFFPAIGNNDWNTSDGYMPYLNYFTLPNNEHYYDFVWGPVHFFFINSHGREPDGNTTSAPQVWNGHRMVTFPIEALEV